jgi:hypothetical protein
MRISCAALTVYVGLAGLAGILGSRRRIKDRSPFVILEAARMPMRFLPDQIVCGPGGPRDLCDGLVPLASS